MMSSSPEISASFALAHGHKIAVIPNKQSTTCKVCLRPGTIEHGFKACEACKRFFKRTRHEITRLTCISGTFNCQPQAMKADSKRGKTCSSFGCRRCRLYRCFAAGLQAREEQQQSKLLANSPIKMDEEEEETDLRLEQPPAAVVEPKFDVNSTTPVISESQISAINELAILLMPQGDAATNGTDNKPLFLNYVAGQLNALFHLAFSLPQQADKI